MTNPWHMARVASRRQLPKPRKMMGPVDPGLRFHSGIPDLPDIHHRCCGYHVCICEPEPSAMDGFRAGYAASIAPMPDEPPPKPIPREYDYPINAAQIAKFMTADDHELHVRQHAELADHLGICILCHSAEHTFTQCPVLAGEPIE